jgi:hypothetical protein
MAVVITALLPVFLLIVLGFFLKRSLLRLETQWHGLERLTYYVLFPVLLIQTLVKADLTKVPVAGVGGALRGRAGALVRPFRLKSRDRDGLLRGTGFVQRLCAGPADGRRCAVAGADHHAANHPRRTDDADRDRDRAGGLIVIASQRVARMRAR